MTSGISHNATDNDSFTFVLYEVAVPVLYGIVTVLGIVGNSLVIYVIVSKERMRTLTNFLLLNLAIADLSFVVVIPPSTAYVFAANRSRETAIIREILYRAQVVKNCKGSA